MPDPRSRTIVRDTLIQPNPHASAQVPGAAPDRLPFEFHRQLPGYSATPLMDAPRGRRRLGAGSVRVKNEAERLGLPAFKVLGASWATYRALVDRIGLDLQSRMSLEQLKDELTTHQH
ncbi:MAG: hypothetical protein R2849_06270 [Thermomicrobiales bacterium]